MATKTSKFERTLKKSHKEIKGLRSKIITNDAERKMRRKVEHYQETVENLEMKMLTLSDLSPDSTTTLKVTKDGFNSNKWSEEIIETGYKLKIARVKHENALELYQEFFGE